MIHHIPHFDGQNFSQCRVEILTWTQSVDAKNWGLFERLLTAWDELIHMIVG
jgi:hypothetical protein